jgi:hypothetical protein
LTDAVEKSACEVEQKGLTALRNDCREERNGDLNKRGSCDQLREKNRVLKNIKVISLN